MSTRPGWLQVTKPLSSTEAMVSLQERHFGGLGIGFAQGGMTGCNCKVSPTSRVPGERGEIPKFFPPGKVTSKVGKGPKFTAAWPGNFIDEPPDSTIGVSVTTFAMVVAGSFVPIRIGRCPAAFESCSPKTFVISPESSSNSRTASFSAGAKASGFFEADRAVATLEEVASPTDTSWFRLFPAVKKAAVFCGQSVESPALGSRSGNCVTYWPEPAFCANKASGLANPLTCRFTPTPEETPLEHSCTVMVIAPGGRRAGATTGEGVTAEAAGTMYGCTWLKSMGVFKTWPPGRLIVRTASLPEVQSK
jgi:hypothetical protein